MRRLPPKAKRVFFLQGFLASLVLFIVFVPAMCAKIHEADLDIFPLAAFLGVGFVALEAAVSWVWADLGYANFWYRIDDRFVVIHRGVLLKKKTSIPYERIQDTSIRRGILAQLMDFSAVKIETAGSSGPRAETEGILPVLETWIAEEIAREILAKAHAAGEP